MSGGLPRYEPGETIQRQGVVPVQGGGAMAALSQSMDRLGAALGSIGEGEKRRREQADLANAEREVQTMTLRDEAGNLVAPTERDWQSPAGRHFNRGAALRYVDEIQIDARAAAVRIRAEAGGDPERFRQSWDAYQQATLAREPQWLRGNLQTTLGRLGSEHAGSVALQAQSQDRSNQGEAWSQMNQNYQRDLEGLAAAGRIDSPEYAEMMTRYRAHLGDGQRARHIAPDAAALLESNAVERAAERAVSRSSMELMAREGPEAALAAFDREADRRAMPPQQRERLRNLVESRANEWRALRQEARSEVNQQVDDWNTRITGGVPVAPDEGLRLAARADQLGQTALAARIRSTQDVYADLQDARRVATPQLTERYNSVVARIARPEGTARDVELSVQLSRMITQRREAMRTDPLGTAMQTHRDRPEVGAIAPLDTSSPEAMTRSLSARMTVANRLGALEGVRNMPVLTDSERQGLTDLIANGNRDQQVALLAAFSGGLGAQGMARTLDSLFPGTQAPNDPRLNAWIGAAGAAARGNMPLATEIISGSDRLSRLGGAPQPLSGHDADRAIETHALAAYGSSPQAYAAISAAARALYVERAASGRDQSDPSRTQTPTLTGSLNSSLMSRVLEQVAPVIQFSGRAIPPPRPGITGTQFAEEMAALPPAALEGAMVDGRGRRLTPEIIRRDGQLVAVGDGRYQVLIFGMPVPRQDGGAFVLDMRTRWPAAPAGVGGTGTGGYYDRLGADESGWDPNARNSRSTATGHFQFIESTWRSFASANPDQFRGMTDSQIMARRTDPETQMRATRWYAGVNAQALQGAGQPVNDGTVALAHRVGSAGATAVLRARDDASLAAVLGEQVMAANPTWRGLTAGDFRNRFRRNYGEGQTWRDTQVATR